MTKQVTIAGKPTVLSIDATQNVGGWEYRLSHRIFKSLERRGVAMLGSESYHISRPEEMWNPLAQHQGFNCLLLQAHGDFVLENLEECLKYLSHQVQQDSKLLAVCVCQGYVADMAEKLQQKGSVPSIMLVPVGELSVRQAAPFFVKFFVELNLHSTDSINGMMAQFAFAKAQKFAPGKVKILC